MLLTPITCCVFFPAAAYVELGESIVTYLQADQLYSTSGKSALFDTLVNYCYKTNDHPFEITPTLETGLTPAIITEANAPQCTAEGLPFNGCLSAPAYSVGYFKIPITAYYPPPKLSDKQQLKDVNIYPNPAVTYFSIDAVYENNQTISTDYFVTIVSLQGNLILKTRARKNQSIDISKLTAGCYQVIISDGRNKFFKKFIKTE